jgi:dihydroorotase
MSEALLLLRGGSVFDPVTGSTRRADIRVRGRVVDDVGADLPANGSTVIDVTGLLLTPGWVDLHTHVFVGQDLGVDPVALGPPSGVTTMIDTGSAGAHLFGAFVAASLNRSGPRIRNFLNVSSIGTTSILLAGELATISYVDEAAAVACARAYPDQIIGIKARASGNVCGDNAPQVLRRSRAIADELNLPLMLHVGPPSPTLPDLLAVLRAGDIVTHSFTALAEPRLAAHGRVLAEARTARDRGVLFDVGHGMSGFDALVARSAIAAGFLPDTISTDAHAYSVRLVHGLPAVASKFLALGLTLPEVLTRVTLAPARAAGLDGLGIGLLVPGGPADVTAVRVTAERTVFEDPQGNRFRGHLSVQVELTVQGGSVVFDGKERSFAGSVRD